MATVTTLPVVDFTNMKILIKATYIQDIEKLVEARLLKKGLLVDVKAQVVLLGKSIKLTCTPDLDVDIVKAAVRNK